MVKFKSSIQRAWPSPGETSDICHSKRMEPNTLEMDQGHGMGWQTAPSLALNLSLDLLFKASGWEQQKKPKPISITTSTQFPTPIYSFALKLRRKMQSIMPKGNSHDPQDSQLQGCCFISSVLSTPPSTAANSDFINIQLLTRFQRLFPGVCQRAKIKRIQWLRYFNDGQAVVKQCSPVFLHYLDLSAWHFQQLGGFQSFVLC